MKLLEKQTVLPLDIIRYINTFKPPVLDDFTIREAIKCWFLDREKCISIYCHISEWNTSKVTNMECLFHINSLFYDNPYFNEDISNWNVSNVTNMTTMFAGCSEFNCDLSKWNVSNVTNMTAMFAGCNKFNSDLSKWNVM